MDEETFIPEQEPEKIGGVDKELNAENINFGPGFVLSASASNNLTMSDSGSVFVSAGQDIKITDGGGLLIAVGRDLDLDDGGAGVIVAGGNVDIMNGNSIISVVGGNLDVTYGGAIAAFAGQASITQGSIGVLFASNVQLGENTKVVLNTPQAIALGAAFGAVCTVLGWLLRRR